MELQDFDLSGDLDLENRLVTTEHIEEDAVENPLRPQSLSEYIGQETAKNNLSIFMDAAKQRSEPLDHVLLSGPPGLGKTTLANIISHEMQGDIFITSGPALERPGDLAAQLTRLMRGDILFIDEIHRLPRTVEEILYPAMEDFAIDIVHGKGQGATSYHMPIDHFTLIGATTRAGQLSAPLRDRFGINLKLEMYSPKELSTIIKRSANILNIECDNDGAMEIASRARGTPRIANRLLKRVRDFAQVVSGSGITAKTANEALERLEIDELGLDQSDRSMLHAMIEHYNGGPVGLDTLAAVIGEESVTVEDVYEPYLMQIGFLSRTNRGRVVLPQAYKHLGMEVPKSFLSDDEQLTF